MQLEDGKIANRYNIVENADFKNGLTGWTKNTFTDSEVVSYTYDSWGKLEAIGGTKAGSVGIANPYRYRGYWYDSETNLYYLQSMYYNPDWGRFISADTVIGETGTLLSHNMFAYCLNNPVNMEDSDGEFAFLLAVPVAIKLAIGIGSVIGAVYTGYTIGTYARHGVEKSNIKFSSKSKSKANSGPVGKANRKKQGREVNEKKRKGDFESRSNKNSNRSMKKHHPSKRGHRKEFN